MSIIEVNHLKKNFDKLEVLKDINLKVEKGDVIAILGPSGSGKSTFLRSLIDLEKVDGGDIKIEGDFLCKDGTYPSGKEIRNIISKMGMVFQHFNLFPHKTIFKNITLAAELNKQGSKDEINRQAESLLNKVGLFDKKNTMPSTLSGGQKQRVAIARALMRNPDIILFDEPTSALDPELTGEVLKVIKNLAEEGNTMLIVTHEIEFAKEVSNKILFIDNGYVADFGTPNEVLGNPKTDRIKAFLNKIYSKNN